MNVDGVHYRTIWVDSEDRGVVHIIDQRSLPHNFIIADLRSVDDFAGAIKEMWVRGAGLIGAAAGWGMYMAVLTAPSSGFHNFIEASADKLLATRPTAVNLQWAVDRMMKSIESESSVSAKIEAAFRTASDIADEDAGSCRKIGENGFSLIEEISRSKGGETVNILTHCNAGWLAFVDYGSALAPVYTALERGVDIHVWVDETRPRNQGARLTAWELAKAGVPYHIIADNTGGHLMQHGMIDMVIVGSDRTSRNGDVANKIGTYLKALAAKDNNIPFYAALPSSTFDWDINDGVKQIPIEERSAEEVKYIYGILNGKRERVLITEEQAAAKNYGFDVTPSRLVTALITERGVCEASEEGILGLYPEKIR